MSLPVRGAWIEIALHQDNLTNGRRSLPVRGAWIEILSEFTTWANLQSRSPCGERGLK